MKTNKTTTRKKTWNIFWISNESLFMWVTAVIWLTVLATATTSIFSAKAISEIAWTNDKKVIESQEVDWKKVVAVAVLENGVDKSTFMNADWSDLAHTIKLTWAWIEKIRTSNNWIWVLAVWSNADQITDSASTPNEVEWIWWINYDWNSPEFDEFDWIRGDKYIVSSAELTWVKWLEQVYWTKVGGTVPFAIDETDVSEDTDNPNTALLYVYKVKN